MVPIAFVVVAGVAYLLYQGAEALLDQGGANPVKVNDIVKTTATGFTLLGAVLTGVYAYRKQRLSEGDAHREDARHLAERYTAAAEQLGHEQAAVRLAGVYAMARLADDWPEQRQVCIDVLCAYIRMPYQPDTEQNDFKTGEREVRLTIIRIIRDHLQDPESAISWCGFDFDFTGATFDGGDFENAKFTGGTINFNDAEFNDRNVNFRFAQFNAGTIIFIGAQFNGGNVHFIRAEFNDGTVHFDDAKFNAGTVNFIGAEFNDGTVHFNRAKFNDGTVHFNRAKFNDGTVHFNYAEFNGGTVHFNYAEFNGGTVNFGIASWAEGGSAVSFEDLSVSDAVHVVWGPFPVIAPNAT